MEGNRTGCCRGKNHKMDHFLEVCLLLLLHDAAGYGYGLIEGLEAFGFRRRSSMRAPFTEP